MSDEVNKSELLSYTTEIVSAHLAHNSVEKDDISALIERVYKTLDDLGSRENGGRGRAQPAVSIKKSITPDYIICLEDGKKLKMLKRHLKTTYDMSPEEYRERWNLPLDYPMVAPNYAKQRSKLARDIGLGRGRNSKK